MRRLFGGLLPHPARPPDELETGRDVAPLVGAAHLQLHAHRAVEVPEVVRLQEHVAELRERQAALEANLDGVLGEHVRHREVLADVAQEIDERQLAEPIEVVDHQRAARSGREVEEAFQLTADRRRGSSPTSPDRAGCARPTGPTGRRSCPSHRRRRRSAGHRPAAGAAARRSARGGRHAGNRPRDRTRCTRRSAGPWPGDRPARGSWHAGCRAIRAQRGGRCPPPAEGVAVTGGCATSSASGRPATNGRSQSLCYRAGSDADDPR